MEIVEYEGLWQDRRVAGTLAFSDREGPTLSQCAVTRERALPAVDAAHIRDYSERPEHAVRNGLLLRSDVHRLFDAGYVTVTPQYEVE